MYVVPSSFSPRVSLQKQFGPPDQRKFGFLSKWFSKSSCTNPIQFKNREDIIRIFWKCVPVQSQEKIYHGSRNSKMV